MQVLNAVVRGVGGNGTAAYALYKVERGRYLIRSVLSGSDFELTVHHVELATDFVTQTSAGTYDDTIEVPAGTLRLRMASGDVGDVTAIATVSVFPL